MQLQAWTDCTSAQQGAASALFASEFGPSWLACPLALRLVALEDEQVLGMATGRVLHGPLRAWTAAALSSPEDTPIAELVDIAVVGQARRKGVGAALIADLGAMLAEYAPVVFAALWERPNGFCPAQGPFTRAGWQQANRVPAWWAASLHADGQPLPEDLCPICGRECVCVARLVIRP